MSFRKRLTCKSRSRDRSDQAVRRAATLEAGLRTGLEVLGGSLLAKGALDDFGRLQGHIAVGGAMEAIAAGTIFLIKLIGDTKEESLFWHLVGS